MSRHGEVTRDWGDGEYTFRLGIAEWRKIDERFNIGPYELLRRVAGGTWRADYLPAVIRMALIGGKSVLTADGRIDDPRINRLVHEYVDDRPLLPSAQFLAGLLTDILTEPQGDPLPKSAAAEAATELSRMESSPSPISTAGEPSSASPRKRSTRSRSGNSKPVAAASSKRTGQAIPRPSPPPQTSSTT